MNPPVIQVTQADTDSVITNPLDQEYEQCQPRLRSRSPANLNPFRNVHHIDHESSTLDENTMVVDGISLEDETNPFRRLSSEGVRTEVTAVEDEEMKS